MARTFNPPGRAAVSVLLAFSLVGQGLLAGISQAQMMTIDCPTGFTDVVIPPAPGFLPFVPLTSLKTVPNPVLPKDPVTGAQTLRGDLAAYVANLTAAIRLGKALFWDMQAGSDNKTACATCHFQAGADARDKNQLNPGPNGSWDGYSANQALLPADFPFTIPQQRDRDNIAGSQGVRKSTFKGIGRGGAELITSVADPVFNVGGVNTRQVTGVNTPSSINAVFNHRNFWNGRAQPEFNGVNPWGHRDRSFPRVWMVNSLGTPVKIDIRIQDASLASQAVGPPLNATEMSAAGRTFPDLGKKLLARKPLGLQKVDPTDSVLGGIADTTTGKGLRVSYKTLVQTAFQPKWWNSRKSITLNRKSYTVMEANFSLFWGLSIMLYEATLVSDESPVDQYLETRVLTPDPAAPDGFTLTAHDPTRLDQVVNRLSAEGISVTRDDILNGLALFELPLPLLGTAGFPAGTGVGCGLCHVGAETTSASLRNLTHGLEPGDDAFNNQGFDLRMERMFMTLPPVPLGTTSITYDPSTYTVIPYNGTPARVATYDSGWYNIGVRPTADDPGLGGKDAFDNPLSWTELFQTTLMDPGMIDVPGGGLGCATSPPAAPAESPFAGEVLNPLTWLPLLSGPLDRTEATDVAGTFKVPSLRNVELNGPYFHNGGKATLRQAVALYDEGGNFNNPTLSPLIRPVGMTPEQVTALVTFLLALTDERVLYQRAPFDHPELIIPEGQNANGSDITMTLPAVGAAGSATPLQRFLNLDPFLP